MPNQQGFHSSTLTLSGNMLTVQHWLLGSLPADGSHRHCPSLSTSGAQADNDHSSLHAVCQVRLPTCIRRICLTCSLRGSLATPATLGAQAAALLRSCVAHRNSRG